MIFFYGFCSLSVSVMDKLHVCDYVTTVCNSVYVSFYCS